MASSLRAKGCKGTTVARATAATTTTGGWAPRTTTRSRRVEAGGTSAKNGAWIRTSRRGASRNQTAMSVQLSQDELKKQAAWKAVEYVKSGMRVGLGTGSTAAFAVARVGELLSNGTLTDIVCVPTSVATQQQAESLGIPLATLDEVPKLDVAIDGADEVDPALERGQGQGRRPSEGEDGRDGQRLLCVHRGVDETKLVSGLGGSKLAMPVEIVQFCWKYNLERLRSLEEVAGCEAKLRMDGDAPYVTDNSNYIVDLYFEEPIKDSYARPRPSPRWRASWTTEPFLDMVTTCIIAGSDGVIVKEK